MFFAYWFGRFPPPPLLVMVRPLKKQFFYVSSLSLNLLKTKMFLLILNIIIYIKSVTQEKKVVYKKQTIPLIAILINCPDVSNVQALWKINCKYFLIRYRLTTMLLILFAYQTYPSNLRFQSINNLSKYKSTNLKIYIILFDWPYSVISLCWYCIFI